MTRCDLQPTPNQVRAFRQRFGVGLVDAKKKLLRSNLTEALDDLGKETLSPNEARLRAILQAAFDGGLL